MADVKRSFFENVSQPLTVTRTENVTCNLCGSGDFTLLAEENGYAIRACAACGLVYVSPQPVAEELPAFYEGLHPAGDDGVIRPMSLGWVEKHICRLLRRWTTCEGRLLEVGCGGGWLLAGMAQLGFEVTGLELDQAAAQHARAQVPGADIRCISLEEAGFEEGSFHAIAAIAVLEHLKNPRQALRSARALLKPGGLLLIQVPYIQHFIRLKRWFPRLPIHFEAPRHLYDFSPATLGRMLTEEGFADLRYEVARPYMSQSAFQTAMIWAVKLPAIALHALSGRRWVYPYSAAFVAGAHRRD